MRTTLQLVGLGCLALGALGGCRQYEGRTAMEKVAAVSARNDDFADRSVRHADQIQARLSQRSQARADRIRGYLSRHSDASPRDQRKVEKLRSDSRAMAGSTFNVTDIVADAQVYGTVKAVRGDQIELSTEQGPIALQAAENSRVVVDGREVPLQALPLGAAVEAKYGSLDGASYFYEVALR